MQTALYTAPGERVALQDVWLIPAAVLCLCFEQETDRPTSSDRVPLSRGDQCGERPGRLQTARAGDTAVVVRCRIAIRALSPASARLLMYDKPIDAGSN